jgi:hypothetical protein
VLTVTSILRPPVTPCAGRRSAASLRETADRRTRRRTATSILDELEMDAMKGRRYRTS